GQTGEGTALESELAVWFFGDVVVFVCERRLWRFWGFLGGWTFGFENGGRWRVHRVVGGWSTGCGPGRLGGRG
ncbi:MAG: hypothetical protein H7836_07860, partial [Magnetococcus sp. YQC-3]